MILLYAVRCWRIKSFSVLAASLLTLITFSFFFFFYCCVSCCLSRSHLEKHLQREGIAAHTHFSFQHLFSDESDFFSFADMSRKKSFTLFLNLKIWGELSSYSQMCLCCSNHSSCECSACFDAHIAQALLVFVMRIKNWFDLGAAKLHRITSLLPHCVLWYHPAQAEEWCGQGWPLCHP